MARASKRAAQRVSKESRSSATSRFARNTTALSLLALFGGCAGKDAGQQQPISENLAPAVASPTTEAFVPLARSNSTYTDDQGLTQTKTTAPMSESNPPKPVSKDAVRESRHAFVPKVNRTAGLTTAPLPAGADETVVVVTGLSNGQIVRIAETMQNANLAQASIVAERAQDARVKQFAEQLGKDSKRQKERTQELAKSAQLTPAESPVSADMRVKASQELTSVELARPEEFDRAFIDAQVQENEEMLQLLNARLIPSASEPKLKDELTKSKATLERQTDEARDIQRSLETSPR